ncbi:hypothetical protein K488DRAFT_52742 [Vararia minispora EC-137]|uniref:Uncharacterized protein n=1 Tax=Vararia minispora EC-137 TaxID=1314806 RepID=A0ACB8QH46_9AGAM|nr:hypothetical protein K488DRAFT_52742 [Vararia minispora EC-137]
MGLQTNEQLLHDRINLTRLVRKLDKSVAETDWDKESELSAQVKSHAMFEKTKHARRLLQEVRVYDEMDGNSFQARHADVRRTLDRLESTILQISQRAMGSPPRPPPILPSVPLPPAPARGLEPAVSVSNHFATHATSPTTEKADVSLLLGSVDETPRDTPLLALDPMDPTFLPSRPRSDPSPSALTSQPQEPAFLQNSAKLHEEMSTQLAQMARQLKSNATYFSEALSRDQTALATADEKIGANLDVMRKERVRLRDHRGKSMGTTCLTITSIVVVLASFIVMFFLIRFTRR